MKNSGLYLYPVILQYSTSTYSRRQRDTSELVLCELFTVKCKASSLLYATNVLISNCKVKTVISVKASFTPGINMCLDS